MKKNMFALPLLVLVVACPSAASTAADADVPASARPGDSAVRHPERFSPRTAYLLSPSAFLMKRGEGAVSLKMMMIGTAEYGLLDHVNLGVDFVVPAIPGIKATVGASLSEYVHLAAGIRSFAVLVSPDPIVDPMGPDNHEPFVFHVPHGVATAGTPDLNVSVARGYFLHERKHISDLRSFYTISGLARIRPGVALMAESWYVRAPPRVGNPIPLIGLRWMPRSGSRAWDFGFLLIDPDGLGYLIPLPWVAYNRAF